MKTSYALIFGIKKDLTQRRKGAEEEKKKREKREVQTIITQGKK
jgi:hypothetical protein